MEKNFFLHSILDTLAKQIVVIDSEGNIVFTNKLWRESAEKNQLPASNTAYNYMEVCRKAVDSDDELAKKVIEGFEAIKNNELNEFYHEYPCHSLEEKRWFLMTMKPMEAEEGYYFVISHMDITERKLSEELQADLSRRDWLSNLKNRRAFEEEFKQELRRCQRLHAPATLALLDLDHFKLINDHQGHQMGDNCIRIMGNILNKFAQRPSDIAARFGGEEFILVLGNTNWKQAETVLNKIHEELKISAIANPESPIGDILTLSTGALVIHPRHMGNPETLIRKADKLLYQAKTEGRDRIIIEESHKIFTDSFVAAQ